MIIDVSKHQGEINWALAESKVDTGIIRSGTGTAADPRYYQNWIDSRNAGIGERGVYHYYVTETPPLSQLDAIRRITQDDFGNIEFTIDCERRQDETLKPFPAEDYTRNLTKFLDEFQRRYNYPLNIYTSKHEWEIITLPSIGNMSEFGLHVADYRNVSEPAMPRGWSKWDLWQYTSKAQVPGISTNVDASRRPDPPVNEPVETIRIHAEAILEIEV